MEMLQCSGINSRKVIRKPEYSSDKEFPICINYQVFPILEKLVIGTRREETPTRFSFLLFKGVENPEVLPFPASLLNHKLLPMGRNFSFTGTSILIQQVDIKNWIFFVIVF